MTTTATRELTAGDVLYSPRGEEWTVAAVDADLIWGKLYTLRSSSGRTRKSTAAALSLWTSAA